MPESKIGFVRHFNAEKKFGFISPNGSRNREDNVFFHISALPISDDLRYISRGAIVEYTVEDGRKGKQAANILVIEN